MASAGIGTAPHMAGELFKMMTSINMLHVPFRGGPPALTAVLGGQVQVYFVAASSSIELIKTNRLRALAVTTATRLTGLPEIPTVGEFVSDYEASVWFGVGAPKSTPAEFVDRLNTEINLGLADPKVMSRLADQGNLVLRFSPDQFGKLIADETEKWGKVIKFAGIKAGVKILPTGSYIPRIIRHVSDGSFAAGSAETACPQMSDLHRYRP